MNNFPVNLKDSDVVKKIINHRMTEGQCNKVYLGILDPTYTHRRCQLKIGHKGECQFWRNHNG